MKDMLVAGLVVDPPITAAAALGAAAVGSSRISWRLLLAAAEGSGWSRGPASKLANVVAVVVILLLGTQLQKAPGYTDTIFHQNNLYAIVQHWTV